MRPRVLVVDDSAFARKVLREVLSDDPRIEVVGFARDGLDALEKIQELSPDVITLDLVMPMLDGPGVLQALADKPSPPRAVIVTTSEEDSPRAVEALQLGAFDLVHKPTALATARLYELRDELVTKVLAAAAGQVPAMRRPASVRGGRHGASRTKVVVIGTSTGGPRALTMLLAALPESLATPIVAVVHMPPGFTEGLCQRLDHDCALHVMEADGDRVVGPGTVTIAKAGAHLRVRARDGECAIVIGGGPAESLHRPSADVLFESAADAFGPNVLGIVLTGMGADGLEGARAIRAAGGRVLVEDASTCVVHGMPRAVADAGLADAVVPLDAMARALVERL